MNITRLTGARELHVTGLEDNRMLTIAVTYNEPSNCFNGIALDNEILPLLGASAELLQFVYDYREAREQNDFTYLDEAADSLIAKIINGSE